jgi:hypothetical protein
LDELADSSAAAFYRHRVQAELDQAIGRLRGSRRPGEKLTVYLLSDYPLDRPVRLVEASALAQEALPRAIATDKRIEQAIAQLEKLGDVTLKAIARLAQVSLGRVAKSEAWKSYQKRVSVWSVVFPNVINNIATWKNHKPPANTEPEPTTVITPEIVPAAVEPRAMPAAVPLGTFTSTATLQLSQQEVDPTPQPVQEGALNVGTTVTRWGWGNARYVISAFVDDLIVEITSLSMGARFTVFRSLLTPVLEGAP